jgi:ADP-heptose:LPS heptosyltransferase
MFIDRYIGLPLANVMNVFIRITGKLLRLDHSLDKPFQTIAVAKYKGLGSIIQATPLLQTLRVKYPEAKLLFITTKENQALVEGFEMVDEVIVLKEGNIIAAFFGLIKLILLLWKRKIGVFLDLEIYANTSSLITSFSLARNRMGFYLRSSNYRLGMYTHMMYYNIQSPVSEAYLQFARLLGCEQPITTLYSLQAERAIRPNLPEKYMLINPNASDLRIERRWSGLRFVELINALSTAYSDYALVLVGSRQEQDYVNGLVVQLNKTVQVINLAGKTTLDELIAVIAGAKLMITNDTGPMHLGFALHTNMVALFGPCSPEQYGHESTRVLYKRVYCSPCVHEFDQPPCKGNNVCMQLISVQDVLNEVKVAMEKKQPFIRQQQPVIYQTNNKDGKANTLGIVHR